MIECPACDGYGCEQCDGGRFEVDCPKQFCQSMVEEINIASCAISGFLPVSGGVLDQTSWFVDLWQTLVLERDKIEAEAMKRGK